MANLTYQVQVDWDSNSSWSGANEDITANVLSMDFSRGRNTPHHLAGVTRHGRARIAINNNSGLYSPSDTGGPLYGSLVPGRPVRIRSKGSSTYSTQWQGFIQSIIPKSNVGELNTVTLTCIGPLAYIGDREIETAVQSSVTVDEAITAILDGIGWSTSARDLDVGKTVMTRWWADRITVRDALRKLEETENGLIYETKDGKIAFRHGHDRFTNRTSTALFSDVAGSSLGYESIAQADPIKGIYNILDVQVELYTTGTSGTLWSYPDTIKPYIAPAESFEVWARYPVNDSPIEDVAVESWQTPVENTDYDANSAADGSGDDLSSTIAVSVDKFAQSMKITFTNQHNTKPVYLVDTGGNIKIQARGTPLEAADPLQVRQESTDSQGSHGERTYSARSIWFPDRNDADEWARVNVELYKDPHPIIAITIPANRNQSTLDTIKALDINDRITVRADGDAGLKLNQDWFIEAERHVIRDGFNHRVTYDLSDVTEFDLFWMLGTSALGTATKLGRGSG